MLTDLHTHSAFSADGVSSLEDMLARAASLRIDVYGVSEHFDYDYRADGVLAEGKEIPYIDEERYFSRTRRLQQEYAGRMRVLVGGEFGFSSSRACCDEYARVAERYRPDYVVNSVHVCDGFDCYFPEYFAGKTKDYAYRRYLERVRESLEAPYSYDIMGHLGYVSRNAPYPDRKLRYEDFAEPVDDILKAVIRLHKILEVNTSVRGAGCDFLPDTDILTRYFSLGGRLIAYGSDAHDVSRIAAGREEVVAALRRIGFQRLALPCGGVPVLIEL